MGVSQVYNLCLVILNSKILFFQLIPAVPAYRLIHSCEINVCYRFVNKYDIEDLEYIRLKSIFYRCWG
uniref:Uncharacterized protein n=1 Tax=Mus musculus TaxID=10090 RepID=Q3V3T6_MOUSE|nr:unnamed protein product [Mus musculus]